MSRALRLRRLAALVAAGVSLAAAPARADVATVFTIAGTESTGAAVPWLCGALDFCESPKPWPAVWAATSRRIDATCVDHYPDGSILLCVDGALARLTPDGRMRAVQVPGLRLGPSVGRADDLNVTAADLTPDGGMVFAGYDGAAAMAPDGTVRELPIDYPAGIDVLADGSVLVGDWEAEVVERVWPDGRHEVVAGRSRGENPDGVPARSARIGTPADVAAFPDGSFVIADESPSGRILRVDAAGVIHHFAGGGRGWREGAPATSVKIGPVASVRALSDGGVLLAADRGVLQIDPGGRIHTLVRGVQAPGFAGFLNQRSAGLDARPASDVVLNGVRDADVLTDGRLVALTQVPTGGSRLALVGDPSGLDRLAIALPAEDRVAVSHGRLDLVATRPATVHVTVREKSRTQPLADLRTWVPAGRTTLTVPAARGARVHVVHVEGVTDDGRVASADLAAIPAPKLTTSALAPLKLWVDLAYSGSFTSQDTLGCRRASPRRFRCRWVFQEEGEAGVHGSSSYTLRPDGLIDYVWRRDHGRRVQRLILEPRW
ncbi:MAG TPA: hypothetical protein VI300_02875 [Solirubrobacter sp.]